MAKPPGLTLGQALATALNHWYNSSSLRVLSIQARVGVAHFGSARLCASLGPPEAVGLIKHLELKGLSRKSVQDYYGTFKRVLALSGFPTTTWPKAATPPRKTRDRLQADDLERLIGWLDANGKGPTGDLCRLLKGTGARVAVEGLATAAMQLDERDTLDGHYDTLHITGKGGHERLIPVVDGACRALLRDAGRLDTVRAMAYGTHARNIRMARTACGITSRLATAHAIRHGYASDALRRSGGNIALVQELLGHADPATTARYLHPDMSDKAAALTSPIQEPT